MRFSSIDFPRVPLVPRGWFLAAAALMIGSFGCGGSETGKVTGAVLLDGEPLGDAQLVFWPASDLSLGSFGGKTDAQGRFEIKIDRAKPGRYVVLVTKGDGAPGPGEGVALPPQTGSQRAPRSNSPALPNPNSLPKKYGDKQKSPFVFDITKGNNPLPPLELTSR